MQILHAGSMAQISNETFRCGGGVGKGISEDMLHPSSSTPIYYSVLYYNRGSFSLTLSHLSLSSPFPRTKEYSNIVEDVLGLPRMQWPWASPGPTAHGVLPDYFPPCHEARYLIPAYIREKGLA